MKMRLMNRPPYRSSVSAILAMSVASSPRPMMFTFPKPSDGFDWVQAAGGPALVCRSLEPFARHLFTTRDWALGSRSSAAGDAGWDEVASSLDVAPDHLLRLHQVHGATVVVHRANGASFVAAAGRRPDADIIITDDPDVAVAIQTADCVPLLIADRRSGAVGAAHAGWRGLVARVPEVAVASITREFGSRPSDLFVAIGPAISACCYEVGEDVRSRFISAGFAPSMVAEWFSDDPLPSANNPSIPGLPNPRRRDHWYFDPWAVTRDQLAQAGVPSQQVFVSDVCTASHSAHLCSYRRDGLAAGRIAAAIRPMKSLFEKH